MITLRDVSKRYPDGTVAVVAVAALVGAVLVRNPGRVVLARHCAGGQLVGAPREAAHGVAAAARALTRAGTGATAVQSAEPAGTP